jgi:hypothetical protein
MTAKKEEAEAPKKLTVDELNERKNYDWSF